MVAKIKINDFGDCVYSEDAVIDLLYADPDLDISKIPTEAEQYNRALAELGIDLPRLPDPIERTGTVADFDRSNYAEWHMPESYAGIDVKTYLLERCGTDVERERVQAEYALFESKGFTKVLQFLIYFVDTLRANNVVWGVGRGSSVSSFCLFLIGVHKINPLLYNLDYREFLR
jgi:DNA polymerase III alpha subunit